MAKRRHRLIPLFSTRATATISVALVLFMLGLASLIGLTAQKVTDNIREKMGFVVLMVEDAKPADIKDVQNKLKQSGVVASMTYTSPEDVLARWQQMVGEGEDILRLGGVNPFVAELEVHVKPSYASADSINALAQSFMQLPQVSEIKVHTELIENVNSTLRNVTFGLIFVAVSLLIVSFVLIFNTVRLAVYARRFSIYTMKLVGATAGFIRRPFLYANLINGAVAGILASLALAGMVFYTRYADFSLASILSWTDIIPVLGSLIIVGMLICLIAALFAANKYLSLTYDEMFK